jgi:hypothetical protein
MLSHKYIRLFHANVAIFLYMHGLCIHVQMSVPWACGHVNHPHPPIPCWTSTPQQHVPFSASLPSLTDLHCGDSVLPNVSLTPIISNHNLSVPLYTPLLGGRNGCSSGNQRGWGTSEKQVSHSWWLKGWALDNQLIIRGGGGNMSNADLPHYPPSPYGTYPQVLCVKFMSTPRGTDPTVNGCDTWSSIHTVWHMYLESYIPPGLRLGSQALQNINKKL